MATQHCWRALATFLAAGLFAALLACGAQPAPVYHPASAAVQNPCQNPEIFRSASRERIDHLRLCGAINEEEWTCLGSQLDYLGDDVSRRCDVGNLSYSNIAGEQRRRYSTCVIPFDPALVECGLFTTDLECGAALCDPDHSLPAVSAAPKVVAAGTPQAIAGAGDALLSIAVHGYQGACNFRLDGQAQRAHFSALIEGALPGSVVAHEVPAEFYLRFSMSDGTASEVVVAERWLVPVGSSRRESIEGWRLPDVALRDYLRAQALPCR